MQAFSTVFPQRRETCITIVQMDQAAGVPISGIKRTIQSCISQDLVVQTISLP